MQTRAWAARTAHVPRVADQGSPRTAAAVAAWRSASTRPGRGRGRRRGSRRGGGGRSCSPRAESTPPVAGDVPVGAVSEILRRLDELHDKVRNRDGVVQQLQLQLDDVMARAAGPPRRRGDVKTDPVVVGTATTPQPPRVALRASEDNDVIATNNKEDLTGWRNSHYGKRWYLTGQRPMEATMTIDNMAMRLRKVAAVDQKVLSMMDNLGAFDIRAMKAPNDVASASIDLPVRLAIFNDALMAVVSRGVSGAVCDARLDVLRSGLEEGAGFRRQHATAHRSAMREPANYEVLADIINDDPSDWAGNLTNQTLAIMREFPAPPRADEFPDVLVPSWSHLKTYISVGGFRTSRHVDPPIPSGGRGGGIVEQEDALRKIGLLLQLGVCAGMPPFRERMQVPTCPRPEPDE
eukprot:g5980.t1